MDPSSSRSPADAGLQIIDVIVAEPGWRRHVARPERVVQIAAMAVGVSATFTLASDRAVKLLNSRFRGPNKPTNVLTFEPASPELPGDIVLALETVVREAAAARRSVSAHLSHLVVHGGLHLLGLDHGHAGDARRMEMAEARILARIGISNPWKHGRWA